MSKLTRSVWAEVNLEDIAFNTQQFRRLIGNSQLMAVVKANAYGHGALEVAHTVLANGASWLAVAIPEEGVRLRRAGIAAPILVLGAVGPEEAEICVAKDLAVTLYEPQLARILANAARKLQKAAKVHVKVDTGMSRLGVTDGAALDFIRSVIKVPGIEVQGVFTHFADAENPSQEYLRWQWQRFERVMAALKREGIEIPCFHAANTAAAMFFPESHLDLVRIGGGLYGMYPDSRRPIQLRPALSLKTRIAALKSVPAGTAVSYGCTYVTWKDTTLAVLPIGYADGLSRKLSNKGHVLIGGHPCPIVGRVTMDHTIVDVSGLPASVGDEVVLIGSSGYNEITVDDWARWMDTINYEVTCLLSSRVERVYV